MKTIWLLFFCIVARFSGKTWTASAPSDEAAIRALENRFIAAFNAGDIDAIMKNYIQGNSFVIFDLVPRKAYRGTENYRRYWEDFFSHFRGIPKIAIADLGITADGNIGFSHSIQHVTGIDKQGHRVNRTVRVTDGYRKISGQWMITLEHVSMPVDLGYRGTGRRIPLICSHWVRSFSWTVMSSAAVR